MTAPLRIAYLCHDPLPSGDTNTEQIVRTTWALVATGVTVDLVLPAARRDAIAGFYGLDPAAPGPSIVTLGGSFAGGATRQLRHDVAAARWAGAAGRGHDLLYTRDVVALPLALRTGKPVFFETYRYDLNTLRRFAPWRALCYRSAGLRGVITHSHLAAGAFAAAGIARDRILVAHNGFDPRALLPVRDRAAARRETGLPGSARIVAYAGHVGPKKGTDVIVAIAALLPGVTFVVIGGEAGAPETLAFAREVRDRGLANVVRIDRVPPAGLAPYLHAADVLLIPPAAAPLARHRRTVLPMKTFLYLAAGRPIVAPDLPDLAEVLTHGEDALLVPADLPAAAAGAITLALEDSKLAERLGSAAAERGRQFTWAARAEKIERFLRDRL